MHITGIYHPPPGNNITNAIFIDEITELLANRITKYNNMVILGDLNIHIDDLSNTDSHCLMTPCRLLVSNNMSHHQPISGDTLLI